MKETQDYRNFNEMLIRVIHVRGAAGSNPCKV